MTIEPLELTLFVTDVDASAHFYDAIGLTLFRVDEPGYPRHYDGDLGFQLWPASVHQPVTNLRLGFRVEDLAVAVQRLDALETPWIRRLPNFVTARDPDGNQVNLAQRRSDPNPMRRPDVDDFG